MEQNSALLKEELSKAASVIEGQAQQIVALKFETETLKMVNSLLGGDENKRETKLKINSLIRDIDYCIAQLSD